MSGHVHDESPADWGWGQVVRHLHDDHDIDIPMFSSLIDAHLTHLKAHQPPEETSVTLCRHQCPDALVTCTYVAGHKPLVDPAMQSGDVIYGTFDHGNIDADMWWVEVPVKPHGHDSDLSRWHDQVHDSAVESHLKEVHGIEFGPDSSVHGLHARAHAASDKAAQQLADSERADGDRMRANLAVFGSQQPVKVFVGKDGFEIGHVNRPENPQVLVDRLICVLADVDFDQEWVPDNGMGPAARGAFRRTWIQPAQRLLRWLEHGGALHLPVVSGLAEELEREQALVMDMEDTNNSLREQLRLIQEANQRQVQAITELEERLAPVQRQRDEAVAERDQLRADKVRLKADLEKMAAERAKALKAQADAVQDARHLDSVTSRAQHERTEASTRAYETQKQLERTQQLLTARTEALATGQAALRNLLQGLNQGTVPLTSGGIMFQLEAILAGQGPQVSTCTEPHLGLASTREILAELTARIEVGHTGLDYRTVDPG